MESPQDLKPLYEAILKGDLNTAKTATTQALAGGYEPIRIVQDWMMPAMDEVGRRFEGNEYFVPELLIAARAMKAALELIRPLLAAGGGKPVGRVVHRHVKGDLHDIGKNLVASMLEGGGFEVIDLGVDVTPEKFVDAVKDKKRQHRRPVRPADHHHARDEDHHRGPQAGRRARAGQGHHRRRAHHPAVRRRNRRRRLQRQCLRSRRCSEEGGRRLTCPRKASMP